MGGLLVVIFWYITLGRSQIFIYGFNLYSGQLWLLGAFDDYQKLSIKIHLAYLSVE